MPQRELIVNEDMNFMFGKRKHNFLSVIRKFNVEKVKVQSMFDGRRSIPKLGCQ